jgi:aquaporin NIP
MPKLNYRHVKRCCLRAAEMIGMFICMLIYLETMAHKKSKAGSLAPGIIGATFGLVILAIGPISGASLNPARSLGPALLSAYFSHLWIYIAGPICGAHARLPWVLCCLSLCVKFR